MKIILRFLLLVFCAAFLYSCSNSTSVGLSGNVTDLFPLKIGNTWTYLIKDYDTTGKVASQGSDIWTVTSKVDTMGNAVYFFSTQNGPSALYYHGDKLFVFGNYGLPLLQYPVSRGAVLIRRDTIYAYPSDTTVSKSYTTFLGDNVVLDLGFEKFFCSKFEFMSIGGPVSHPDSSNASTLYFAAKKGLVKEADYDFYNKVRYLRRTYELQSYKVN